MWLFTMLRNTLVYSVIPSFILLSLWGGSMLALTSDAQQQVAKTLNAVEGDVVSWAPASMSKAFHSVQKAATVAVDPPSVMAARALPATKAASDITVPLKPHNNALMVEATLDDSVSGTFVVDTGATYTSISQQMADKLGPALKPIGTVRITTANGRIDVPKVLISKVSLNGLEAHNVEATIIQVREGSSFQGLLGLSFIKQFQLTINPSQGTLVFRPQ